MGMNFWDLEKTFTSLGGEFVTSPIVLAEKLQTIKALVFDWDGVWHSGKKQGDGQSSFSEIDSIGLNMLRFGYYIHHGKIPDTYIITGENNITAYEFGKREHLNGVYCRAKNKNKAFDQILKSSDFEAQEVMFVYDDILDLGMAQRTGVNFLVNRSGSPLFQKFVTKNKWCDYRTHCAGGENAVREVCELILGLIGQYEEVATNRMNFSELYDEYWKLRNRTLCQNFLLSKDEFVPHLIEQ
jgi:3-deoxy-D-manno-octulosonate 8-phosphate phosphatase (KDO 8-P phosphatase)